MFSYDYSSLFARLQSYNENPQAKNPVCVNKS